MFGLIVSLALAAAAAYPSAPAERTQHADSAKSAARSAPLQLAPWWEKITVTMNGDGKTESCKYESSSQAQSSDDCALFSAGMNVAESQTPEADRNQFTKLTFERRFSPGSAAPSDAPLATGDTLLGREVMAVAINGRGKVFGCKVMATSGDLPPDYSCNDASAERFALTGTESGPRQGFFTIRIYGHTEHVTMRDRQNRRA